MDGFTTYEGGAASWRVYHNNGSTIVRALSEAVALQRFMAKFPSLVVTKIERI